MGAKIESIKLMDELGLPVPKHVFIFSEKDLDKIDKFSKGIDRFTVRTDREKTVSSMPRKFSLGKEEAERLARKLLEEGYQVIFQECIEPENEEKSGNILLKRDSITVEAANEKHHVMANSHSVDVYIEIPRFAFNIKKLVHYHNTHCLTHAELFRLIRLVRKIPFEEAIVEFSFTKDGRLFFWEIKNFEHSKNP